MTRLLIREESRTMSKSEISHWLRVLGNAVSKERI